MTQRKLILAPQANLVTLAQAKQHLRITNNTDEDSLIGALALAATEAVEAQSWRAYEKRTYRMDMSSFQDSLYLPSMPLDSITSVKYWDENNADQTIDSTNYSFSTPDAVLYFNSDYSFPAVYDRFDAVRITYVSGYATADVPGAAVAACYLILGDLYENREGQLVSGVTITPNETVDRLLYGLKSPRL